MIRLLFILSLVLLAAPVSAQRLITAGGTITELVFALGAGEQVVAVDQSSSYPSRVKALPHVGYYRDLAAEGVLSKAPDRLLALEGAGREEVLEQIKSTGVKVTVYDKATDVASMERLIREVGTDLDRTSQAEALIDRFNASLPEPSKNFSGKGLFLLSAGSRGLIAAGTETVPELLFNYVGLENIAAGHQGFKTLGREFIVMQQPDYIVAPYHVVHGAGGKQAFCEQQSLQMLKAAKQCRLLVMDSLMSLGMTPRLSEAIGILDDFVRKF